MLSIHGNNLNFKSSQQALSSSPALRFGWNGDDNLPDDFGVIDMKELPETVKQAKSWADLSIDGINQNPNPKSLVLEDYPVASASLVEQVVRQVRREGADFLDNPGFAYIMTPYEWSDEESVNHVNARYLALSLMEKLQDWSVVPGTEYCDIKPQRWNDYLKGRSGDTTTFKEPHMDGGTTLLALVYGPEKNIEGACPQVSDILDYFYTEQEEPESYLTTEGFKGYVEPIDFDVSPSSLKLQCLKGNYTRTLEKGRDLGRITILVTNNLPGLFHRGVFHGASSGVLLEESSSTEAPRKLYQIQMEFSSVASPEDVENSINLLMNDGLKALNQIIEPETGSKG